MRTQKTIQCNNPIKFDEQVNTLLKEGWSIVDRKCGFIGCPEQGDEECFLAIFERPTQSHGWVCHNCGVVDDLHASQSKHCLKCGAYIGETS